MATLATIAEAAARLSVSPGTIRNLERRGVIHPVRIGRTVKIQTAEIRRIIKSRISTETTATGC